MRKKLTRVLAFLLSICLVLTLMPAIAFAEEGKLADEYVLSFNDVLDLSQEDPKAMIVVQGGPYNWVSPNEYKVTSSNPEIAVIEREHIARSNGNVSNTYYILPISPGNANIEFTFADASTKSVEITVNGTRTVNDLTLTLQNEGSKYDDAYKAKYGTVEISVDGQNYVELSDSSFAAKEEDGSWVYTILSKAVQEEKEKYSYDIKVTKAADSSYSPELTRGPATEDSGNVKTIYGPEFTEAGIAEGIPCSYFLNFAEESNLGPGKPLEAQALQIWNVLGNDKDDPTHYLLENGYMTIWISGSYHSEDIGNGPLVYLMPKDNDVVEITIYPDDPETYFCNLEILDNTKNGDGEVNVIYDEKGEIPGSVKYIYRIKKGAGNANFYPEIQDGNKVSVESVTLDKSKITLKPGETYQLKAEVLPENATNKKLRWEVHKNAENEVYATVDENGLVTAVKEGTARLEVTATDGSQKFAICDITVSGNAQPQSNYRMDIYKTTIDLSDEYPNVPIDIYDGEKLISTGFTISSDNTAVAGVEKKTVSSGGSKYTYYMIVPKSAGTATITAAFSDKDKTKLSQKITVTNEKVKSVYFNDEACTLKVGESRKLRAYCIPGDSTGISSLAAVWTSSDESRVKIVKDENNQLSATLHAISATEKDTPVTVTLSVTDKNGNKLEDITYSVTVTAQYTDKEKAENRPGDLYAITNVQTKLSDVWIAPNWSWNKEVADTALAPLVGEAGNSIVRFAATYNDEKSGKESYEEILPVKLTTLQSLGIELEGAKDKVDGLTINNSVEGDVYAALSWIMTGEEWKQTTYEERAAILDAAWFGNISWNSSNENVLKWENIYHGEGEERDIEANRVKLIAAAPGTSTLSVTVPIGRKDNKTYKEFKASITITVTEKKPANISVTNAEEAEIGSEITYVLDEDSTKNDYVINVKIPSEYKADITSSNPNVLKIGTAVTKDESISTYKVTLTAKAAGKSILQIKTNDDYATSRQFVVNVKDPTPVLATTSATINISKKDKTGYLTVYANEGYTVTAVEITDESESFEKTLKKDSQDENLWIIKATKNAEAKTYKNLKLKISVADEKDNPVKAYENFAVSIKTEKRGPVYQPVQEGKVNLFYYNANLKDVNKDYDGILKIRTSEEIEKEVTLTGCDYTLIPAETGSYDLYYLRATMGDNDKVGKKTSGTLTIKFADYEEEVTAKFTVKTQNTAPKLTINNGEKSVTFYPDKGMTTANLNVRLDGKELGNDLLAKVKLMDSKLKGEIPESQYKKEMLGGSGLKLTVQSGAPASLSTKFSLQDSDWTKAVTAAYTLKTSTKNPALGLSSTKITINANDGLWANEKAVIAAKWADGSVFNPDSISVDPSKPGIAGINNIAVQPNLTDGTIVVSLKNNRLDGQEWIKPKKSMTYKFKVNAKVKGTDYTATKEISVVVVNKAPEDSISITQKGAINVIDRNNAFILVTPKLQAVNGSLVEGKVELAGPSAHLFEADLKDGVIRIKARYNAVIATKTTYKVKAVLKVQEYGSEEVTNITTKEIKIVPKQVKPKLAAIGNNTIYSGVNNSLVVLFTTNTGYIQKAELTNFNDCFELEEDDSCGIISLKENGKAVKGKKYKLQIKCYMEGQAPNEKPYTVTYNVVIK